MRAKTFVVSTRGSRIYTSGSATRSLHPQLDLTSHFTMSRFFRGDSSSESSSDEEELYSDQEEEEQNQSDEESSEEEDEDDSDSDSSSEDEDGVKKTGANKFLRGDSDSESEDEDEGRGIVRSAKHKRFEELEATIKNIDNGEKINDWSVISVGRST